LQSVTQLDTMVKGTMSGTVPSFFWPRRNCLHVKRLQTFLVVLKFGTGFLKPGPWIYTVPANVTNAAFHSSRELVITSW